MSTMRALVLVVALAEAAVAQEWTKPFERLDESLAAVAADADRHGELIAADNLLRSHLRGACYALLRSVEAPATDKAAGDLAEAERLLGSRAEPSKLLSEALANAQKLLAFAKATPAATRAQVSLRVSRDVIRLLDRHAIDQAEESRLLLDRLAVITRRVMQSQSALIVEQSNARRAEAGADPPQ